MRGCLDHAFKTTLPGVVWGHLLMEGVGEHGQETPVPEPVPVLPFLISARPQLSSHAILSSASVRHSGWLLCALLGALPVSRLMETIALVIL